MIQEAWEEQSNRPQPNSLQIPLVHDGSTLNMGANDPDRWDCTFGYPDGLYLVTSNLYRSV